MRIGVPVAAVALGVSGIFGGLDPARLTDRLDKADPGSEVTVDPFALTVEQAVVVDEIKGVAPRPDPGHHLMVLLVTAENRSNASVGSYLLLPASRATSFENRSLVVLDDRLAPRNASAYDADSDVAVAVLNPGLTYRLALVWEFGGPVPEQLPLGLAKLTYRGVTISPDELLWQDPEATATLTMPVRDATKGAI
ncbi:hypothetical protein ACWDTP_34340 [Mycobacterium sp. NPDC003449]